MGFTGAGQVVFAAIMIGAGIMGLVEGGFTAIWEGAPESTPEREVLAYLCALVSLTAGLGLLWRRTAGFAARVLFFALLLWLCLFKIPVIIQHPLEEVVYQSSGQNAVMVAGAWVLYARFATDWEKQRLSFATGDNGVRLARGLYALALVAFGLSHFVYLNMTAPLVPAWLGWPVGWAYFTGGAYLLASLAILVGVLDRLAAALSAWQMGLFVPLVWLPIAVSGHMSDFQWGELVITCALAASALVIADSYRDMPWFASSRRLRLIGKDRFGDR